MNYLERNFNRIIWLIIIASLFLVPITNISSAYSKNELINDDSFNETTDNTPDLKKDLSRKTPTGSKRRFRR